MAKRTRGSARPAHRKPGARPAGTRSQPRPASPSAPAPPADQQGATETLAAATAADVATEPGTPAAPARSTGHVRPRAKPGSILAARSATEYAYVAQDLKRIAILTASLFAILFGLWLIVVVWKLIPLPFY